MTSLYLIQKFWREGLIGALLIICLILTTANIHRGDQLLLCKQQRAADQATWRAAADKARADDLANVRAVEQRNATISEESQRDLQAKLDAARAAAADYRLRAQARTNPGSQRNASVPQAASTAINPARPGDAALVPISAADLDTCAVNSAKAAGWLDWYTRISAP